ncbi:hypothetical protein EJB05_23148, partial [Eragrostis curvula]
MASRTYWYENNDIGELEFINPLSMQKLAESLANELWGQPPQEQQEQHDIQQEQCAYPNPSLTGSCFVRDTKNTNGVTVGTGLGNNMFSFTDDLSGPLNFTEKECMQQSMIDATTKQCCSPSMTERGGGRRSTSSVQEHVIAERKRREKMHHQFATLASIIPDITKTDKVSLLGSTIEYVHKRKDRLKALQDELQITGSSSGETPAFDARCCIGGNKPNNGDDEAVMRPKIEMDVQGATVLLRVVCREKKGVLVMVLTELEKHGISIINTNVVPFAQSSLNIIITAQVLHFFLYNKPCQIDL